MRTPTSPSTSKMMRMVRLGASQFLNQSLQPVSRQTGFILNRPTSVFLEITSECFMRCQMCDMWRNQDGPEALSTHEKIDLLQQLRDWLGPFRMNFTGRSPPQSRQ